MATQTYQQQLEEVQAAISAVLIRGQRYQIGDRTLTRADVGDLQKREKYLRIMAAREASAGSGGMRVRYGTPVS